MAKAEPKYPPPPWLLHGRGVQTMQLVRAARARSFVGPEFDIVQAMPGYTVGGVYFANYTQGSLRYQEMVVIGALVRRGWRVGLWATHVYIDEPLACAGASEIWGMPAQVAQIGWTDAELSASLDGMTLARLALRWPRSGMRASLPWPNWASGPMYSLFYTVTMRAEMAISRGRLTCNDPVAKLLGASESVTLLHYSDLEFVAPAPLLLAPRPS